MVRASRRGPVHVDMTDSASIDAMLTSVGEVDAVICCAASGCLAGLEEPDDQEFFRGLEGKLLGQVHLVRRALMHLSDQGSVTLTSGPGRVAAPGITFGALVNSGLSAFVVAAAQEMPRGTRINAVSPGWVSETLASMGQDELDGMPAADVARAYVRLVEGGEQGQVVSISR